MTAGFEWDEAKAKSNYRKHGVDFVTATWAFEDAFAVEIVDNSMDYGELRLQLIGRGGQHLLTVVYKERGERMRILSARQATRREHERSSRNRARMMARRFASMTMVEKRS